MIAVRALTAFRTLLSLTHTLWLICALWTLRLLRALMASWTLSMLNMLWSLSTFLATLSLRLLSCGRLYALIALFCYRLLYCSLLDVLSVSVALVALVARATAFGDWASLDGLST
jgi:hypothetical protein